MPTKGKGKEVARDEQPMDVNRGEGMSAGVLIKKHQAKLAWSMAGWHGGAALYHLEGCKKCNNHVTHAVEASDLNQLNVLCKNIDHALKVAWPSIIHDIEDDATAGIREDYDQLRKQLCDTRKDFDLEKD